MFTCAFRVVVPAEERSQSCTRLCLDPAAGAGAGPRFFSAMIIPRQKFGKVKRLFQVKVSEQYQNTSQYGDPEEGTINTELSKPSLTGNSTVKVASTNGTSSQKKKGTEPELRSSSYNSIGSMAFLRRAKSYWTSVPRLDLGVR